MLKAVTRQASHVDAKIATINAAKAQSGKPKISTAYFFDHFAEKEDVAVMVTEEDFVNAEKELIPSVSLKELEHYKRVRAQFEKPEEKKPAADVKGKGRAILQIGNGEHESEGARRTNGKGKGKAVDRKGKGRVMEWDMEEEDEFYTGGAVVDGKGKGKAAFQEGNLEDEEGMY